MSILFDLEIKIETKEDALKVVKGASTVFLFTAVLAAIAASFYLYLNLIHIKSI